MVIGIIEKLVASLEWVQYNSSGRFIMAGLACKLAQNSIIPDLVL